MFLAGFCKTLYRASGSKFPMYPRRSDKGAPPMHFNQIPFRAEILYRPAHRDTADFILFAEGRLWRELFLRLVFAPLYSRLYVLFYLLV